MRRRATMLLGRSLIDVLNTVNLLRERGVQVRPSGTGLIQPAG